MQNGSLAAVDREYHQNLDRVDRPAPAATEAPAAAVAVTEAEAPAVAPTEAPVVTTTVAVTAAPVVTTTVATTHTTTWWLIVAAAEVPAESPFRQASPMFLMFALLAGAAVLAVAVRRRHRHVGVASEPLLPAEYEV